MLYFISGADRIPKQKITRQSDYRSFISPISIVSTRPKNPLMTYSKSVIYAYQEPPKVIKSVSSFNPIRVKLWM